MFLSCKKNAPKFWKVQINVRLFFVVFTFCEAIINKLTLKAKGKNFKTILTKQSWAKSKKVERCRDSKGAIQTYLSYFMRASHDCGFITISQKKFLHKFVNWWIKRESTFHKSENPLVHWEPWGFKSLYPQTPKIK